MLKDTSEQQTTARRLLRELYGQTGSWGKLAAKLGTNKGFLSAIARGKKSASQRILKALGIKPRRVYRDLFDWPVSELKRAIEQREEM